MLETDVSEIVNEMITSTRKMGSCGIIAAYAGYTNHFNIGALMEKGIRCAFFVYPLSLSLIPLAHLHSLYQTDWARAGAGAQVLEGDPRDD
jgi:threonine dehydrogenase-like Zn-dependent dehydrogenase